MKRKLPLALIGSWLALTLAMPAAATAQSTVRPESAATATLTGTISNSATRNLLEGARIEIPQLGLVTLSDSTGRYTMPPLPRAPTRCWFLTLASIRFGCR